MNSSVDTFVPRGLGRSYGDASVNGGQGVLLTERLNRFLDFDPETGIVRCECGITFADLLEVFVPRGYFPPVTPGTKHVTIGGAIAADVHGKNHHADGSLGSYVESLELLTTTGDVLQCSRAENPAAFWATIGGMGLTGFILAAAIRLLPIETAYLVVDYERTSGLDATLAALTERDDQYRYSVAWIDCLARGKELGRSVLMRGRHASSSEVPAALQSRRLDAALGRRLTVPFHLPGLVLNRLTVRAFNALYYRRHPTRLGAIEHFEPFFFPLDSVSCWNRIYGRRGFIQYQVLFPLDASRDGLVELLERLASTGRASFLAVLKTMGAASGGMLSFPEPGHTLSLDIPNRPGLEEFVRELDQIVLRRRGRLYLAKDALMDRESFAAMYPQAREFREARERLDPCGRMSSSLARRVGLVAEQ